MSDVPESVLTDADWAALEAAGMATVQAAGGRDWAFRKPSKAIYSAYRGDSASADKAKAADALGDLARACLVPLPGRTLDEERAAWDQLGEDYPGAVDVVGMEVLALAVGPHEVRRRERPGSSEKPSGTRK